MKKFFARAKAVLEDKFGEGYIDTATWTYPDGGTLSDYIVNTDDYNRTIY